MDRAEAIKYLESCLSQVNRDGIISIGRWRSDVLEMAISALRAQQGHFREVTKKMEPLTLDEMRRMDGEDEK